AARLRRDEAERAVLANPRDRAAQKELRRLAGLLWTTASEVVREMQGHRLGAGECRFVARAADASILVLDELGPESARYGGELFDIITRRYAKGLPTAVTSGLTVAEISERYGDAFIRRLAEEGIGHLIDAHPKGP